MKLDHISETYSDDSNVCIKSNIVRSEKHLYSKSRKAWTERNEKQSLRQAYIIKSGKQIPERMLKVLNNCCKKCSLKVKIDQISLLFKKNIGLCMIKTEGRLIFLG